MCRTNDLFWLRHGGSADSSGVAENSETQRAGRTAPVSLRDVPLDACHPPVRRVFGSLSAGADRAVAPTCKTITPESWRVARPHATPDECVGDDRSGMTAEGRAARECRR